MDFWYDVTVFFLGLFLTYKLVMRFLRRQFISSLHDKYIFITGCDTGFGHQVALKLDAMGCHVIAACYTEEGEGILKRKASSRLCTVRLDVTKTESIKEAFQFVKEKVPEKLGLWGLINNAGKASGSGAVEWFSREDYRDILEVNTLGTIDVTIQFLPLLKKSKGRIVLMSSLSAIVAFPRFAPYSISKAGIEAFGDSLRRELSIWGISVHIVEPGGFKTDMLASIGKGTVHQFEKLSPEVKKEYGHEFVQGVVDFTKLGEKYTPTDLSPVVNAVTNAVTSLFPLTRYQVGRETFIFQFLQSAPAFISDFILERLLVSSVKPAVLKKT